MSENVLGSKFDQVDYKNIVKCFPFLYPRSNWTFEKIDGYKYNWCLGVDELPKGWIVLFLLFCKHLKQELIKHNYLEKFFFTQIKEKYGSMRLYNNGYPRDSLVSELTYIFEHLSTYVCEDCGKVANYETPCWITYLCESCYKNSYSQLYASDKNSNRLRRKRYFVDVRGWSNGNFYKNRYNCKPYWEEYLRCRKMKKQELFEYLGIIDISKSDKSEELECFYD